MSRKRNARLREEKNEQGVRRKPAPERSVDRCRSHVDSASSCTATCVWNVWETSIKISFIYQIKHRGRITHGGKGSCKKTTRILVTTTRLKSKENPFQYSGTLFHRRGTLTRFCGDRENHTGKQGVNSLKRVTEGHTVVFMMMMI